MGIGSLYSPPYPIVGSRFRRNDIHKRFCHPALDAEYSRFIVPVPACGFLLPQEGQSTPRPHITFKAVIPHLMRDTVITSLPHLQVDSRLRGNERGPTCVIPHSMRDPVVSSFQCLYVDSCFRRNDKVLPDLTLLLRLSSRT